MSATVPGATAPPAPQSPQSPARTPTPTSRTSASQGNNAAPVLTYAPPPTAPPSADPKVAELQIMFPSVDVPVIEMILESVGGSQDRAIEQLLSMTDPEFRPDELHHARTEEESQLDLDAQFARSLAMQDEQNAQEHRDHRGNQQGLPYEPRVRRSRPHQQGQYQEERQRGYQPPDTPQGGNPPGMIAVEERLGQYAEVGKQTITSLFNRAKAKYSEFQAQNAAGLGQPDRARESQWGDTANEPWRHPSPGPQGTPTPGGGRGGVQGRYGAGGETGSDRSSRSESFSSQSTIDPGPTPISPHTAANPPSRQSAARWQPSDAYDDPSPPIRANSSSNRIDVNGRRSPGVGSPDKGTTAGKIDPAKLGILPKKRVDLLSTSPPPTTPQNKFSASKQEDEDDDPNPSLPSASKSLVSQIPKTPPAGNAHYSLGDSDDDLEYTKNPFDEK